MSIPPDVWAKAHGASTHFPLAMVLAASLFDGLGGQPAGPSRRRERLRAAGYCTVVLGALGALPAVLSGLFLTHGDPAGRGPLLYHHLFVWPAFAVLLGLAGWRVAVGERYSQRGFSVYLALLFLDAALMAAAGFWGGELVYG